MKPNNNNLSSTTTTTTTYNPNFSSAYEQLDNNTNSTAIINDIDIDLGIASYKEVISNIMKESGDSWLTTLTHYEAKDHVNTISSLANHVKEEKMIKKQQVQDKQADVIDKNIKLNKLEKEKVDVIEQQEEVELNNVKNETPGPSEQDPSEQEEEDKAEQLQQHQEEEEEEEEVEQLKVKKEVEEGKVEEGKVEEDQEDQEDQKEKAKKKNLHKLKVL